jgi:hypothetical protein
MSAPEAPVPKSLWAKVQWTLQQHPWVFFLIAMERLAEHDFQLAAVFGAIFVADLFMPLRGSEWVI